MDIAQAQKMIDERFEEYPELGDIGRSESFDTTLSRMLEFEGIEPWYLPLISHEGRVVRALYAPVSLLANIIAETTGLSYEKSRGLTTLIKTMLLQPVIQDLEEYAYHWKNEELETDEKAPDTNEHAQPLTRDELMRALERRQTGGIEAMRQKLEQAAQRKTVGYDAVEQKEHTGQ
jgi:hypothetical protein